MRKKSVSYTLVSSALLLAAPLLNAQTLLAATESPRIVRPVNDSDRSTRSNSHLKILNQAAKSTGAVDDAQPINHMRLILQRSAARTAALQSLITDQHDPTSTQFQHWVSPALFGNAFGVSSADIDTVTKWLTSQGFVVNAVSANELQIDFSGTAGQIRKAFQTQETRYTMNGVSHIANDRDITLPTALNGVVLGVAGLNDFQPHPLHKVVRATSYDKSTHLFEGVKTLQSGVATAQRKDVLASLVRAKLAVQGDGVRGLVPYDMQTIYDLTPLYKKGITGKGVTIALVGESGVNTSDWNNFVTQFGLGSYGATFSSFAPSGAATCNYPAADPSVSGDAYYEAVLDAEYSTALAPGATIWSANCSAGDSSNFFGGVFNAASNLINNSASSGRPNVISMSYGYGEDAVDAASKEAFDQIWAQADAEGISVFISSGDSSANPDFNGSTIYGKGLSVNAAASSANDTVVGGTDTADLLAGTSSKYFGTPNALYGSALSYVPEISWNESCGNTYAAQQIFNEAPLQVCKQTALYGAVALSEGSSGGASVLVAKPVWQRIVAGAAKDQSRDLPDVSLFGGSFGSLTMAIICTVDYPCQPNFPASGGGLLIAGTSLSSPMFAGIQGVLDQGLYQAGAWSVNQGNAAPTLYQLASSEYGGATGSAPATLSKCSALNGTKGTGSCVFHNITAGGISAGCADGTPIGATTPTTNCYYYGKGNMSISFLGLPLTIPTTVGLTTTDAAPTSYTAKNAAYLASAGWSFANGLGSVDASNLLGAWKKFDGL